MRAAPAPHIGHRRPEIARELLKEGGFEPRCLLIQQIIDLLAASRLRCGTMLILSLIVGVLAGLLSGLVGVGGGTLIIPALVYFFHMSQHRAQGTSLGVLLLPSGALAFWQYYKAGNVDVKMVILIVAGFLLGGHFGGRWAQTFSDVVLRKSFAVFLVMVALKMFFQK